MWNRQTDKERLTILETMFKEFQASMVQHMIVEDKCFNELKASLKEITDSIHKNQQESLRVVEHTKVNLLSLIDKEYTTKLELEKHDTKIKEYVGNIVDEERRRATKEIWLVLFGFSTAFGIVGWIVANVLGIIPK